MQRDKETVADYVAELRRLSKTCNFGDYLDTALRDQLVCGLNDRKTQKELLCIKNLTLTVATDKARAAETVNREVQHFPTEAEVLKLTSPQNPCPRCGQQGHTKTTCYYRNKHCRFCKKWDMQVQFVGITSRKKHQQSQQKHPTRQSRPMHTVATTVNDSEEEFDKYQLSVHKTASTHSNKLTTVLQVDGVA